MQVEDAGVVDLDLARRELAELVSHLEYVKAELAALRAGTRFPAMAADRRATSVREHEDRVRSYVERIARLSALVPDPEAVVDAYGSTPGERRVRSLARYVESRRARRADLQAQLAYVAGVVADKKLGAKVRRRAREEQHTLETHLAVIDGEPNDTDLRPEDMCPDAVHPLSHHGWTYTMSKPTWPCSAWPSQSGKLTELNKILDLHEANRRDEDLVRWEFTLLCGHTAEKTAHHTNTSSMASSTTLPDGCPTCSAKPAFILSACDLGRLAPPPPEPSPTPISDAQAKALKKRRRALQAQLDAIDGQLGTAPSSPRSTARATRA